MRFGGGRAEMAVDSSEIAADKNDWRAVRKEVLDKVRERYQGKPEVFKTKDGDSIIVTWSGLKHTLNHGVPTWQDSVIALHIDELISNAELNAVEPDKLGRSNPHSAGVYYSNVEIDGVKYRAVMHTRIGSEGEKHYDHTVLVKESQAGQRGGVADESVPTTLPLGLAYENTTTTNLTKQQATDIISQDADGKRLLKNGKLKVLDSIDEAPAHVLEQAKRSEVASYDDYAVLANVFLGYAESGGATQFASISSTNIEEITEAVGSGVLSVVDNGDGYHFYKDGKKVASLLDNFDGTVEINTASLSADGSGKMIMHIALEYAFNNGLRLKPNGGLTTINTYRFTESMLSSALRHGTTKHLMPDVAAQRLTGWSSANDNEKILLLLQRSYENTIKNTPSLPDATYDLRTSSFMGSSGNVLTDEKIFESLRNDDVARKAGIGMATFKKAVVARSILEALQDGRAVAQPLVDEEYGLAKVNGLLYSQDGNIQGFFDPVTDTTYLVADALTADTINGVLVHEVGVHAWWAKANSDKKAALEKRAMQLLNQGKYGNEKIKAFYAAVEQRMIDADVQGNAEEAAAYIVEEAINQAGAERYALSDSRLIDWVAKNVSQSLANFLSEFISSVRASMHRIGWLKTANLTGADLVAIAKRNMREVATSKGVESTQSNVSDYAGVLASMASDTPTQAEIAQAQRDLDKQLAIADKVIADNGYLTAPNGEKSNLNKQQWAQVRTPQFKAWFGDWEGSSIVNGDSIVDLKTEDAPQGGFKDVEAWAENVFNQQGGKAVRVGFGEVALDKRSAKSSLAHGGANLYKKTAFLAVKDVIERGALIHSESNGVEDSFYFSAPVTIDGVVNIETVLVHRDVNTNRMYLHSVSIKESLKSQRVSSADDKSSKHSGSIGSKGIASVLNSLLNGNGISKVVDANGEPLVVYHGTNADFEEFKKSGYENGNEIGDGFYFSPDSNLAGKYAESGNVMSVYLNMKNPFVIGFDSSFVLEVEKRFGFTDKQYKEMGKGYRKFSEGSVATKVLMAQGFDGVSDDFMQYVAFNPNQIKSAIGNVGTFSGKTGNINFSKAGTTQPASSLIAPRETFKDRLIVDYVDDMNRVKQLQDMVNEKVGADSSQVYDAAMRYRAITPSRLLDMQRSVERIIKGAAKDGVTSDVLGLYMYAVHAPERNAYLFERDEVENGSGMTDTQAADIVAQLKQEYPNIDNHAQAFRKLLDAVMDIRVANGTVSQEQAAEWKQKMPNYVPLKHSIEDAEAFEANTGITQLQGFAGMGTGTKFNLTGKEIKRANGRVSQAGHILENAMFDMQKGIIRAEKNNVLVEFARTVARHRDAVMNGKALWDVYGKKPDNMTNVVEYMVDGRRGYIRINDQSMHDAFASMDGDAFTWVDSAVQFIKKTITAWYPAFTIVNGVRDTQTALLNGSQELGVKGAAKMAAYVPSAMTASWRYERGSNNEARSEWDKWHERYRLAGGKTGFLDVRPIEKIQRDINNLFRINNKAVTWKDYALKTGNAMWQVVKVVEDMGGATENMWRLAAFRVAVEQGKSVKEAARIAKNLTVNFDRRGKNRQTLEKVFLFYNAAIQGTVRMKQSMAAKGALAIVGGLMAAGFLAASQDWEDEEGNNLFDLLPEHEKMRGIPIMIADDGKRIVIPMAYGFGYFVYMGMKLRQMQRYVETDGMQGVSIEKGLSDLFNGVALHFNPFGGQQFAEAIKGENDQLIGLLTPVITDPFVQIATNKNAFGGSLYPENAYNPNDRPDSEKAFEYQKSSIYYDIAHTLSRATGGDGVKDGLIEVAPATLEALVRAFTGGAGQFVEKTLTLATRAASDEMDMVEPANVPVGSVVYKKGQDKLYYDAYQELVRDVQKAANDLKRYNKGESDTGDVPMEAETKWQLRLTDDAKQAKKALDEIRDEEKALNKEYRAAEDKDTRAALRAEIERIKAQKVQVQSEFIRRGKEERAAGDN